jgi:hypothetical protein
MAKPKKEETTPAPAAELIKVRVACSHPIGEESGTYFTGDVFETTAERAAALGDLVTPVDSETEPEA